MSELSELDIVEVFENGVKLYRIKGVDNETFSSEAEAEGYIKKIKEKKRREKEEQEIINKSNSKRNSGFILK